MIRLIDRLPVVLLLAACSAPAALAPIEVRGADDAPRVALRVAGEVPKAIELTADALSRMPREKVKARGSDGNESEYEGVPLVEVLRAAGVKFGHELRGPALAAYVVVEAADGYRVVFAMPELDPDYTDRVVLLADRGDGRPLDAREGPLRVIVPGEKRPVRWVRQVAALKVGRG